MHEVEVEEYVGGKLKGKQKVMVPDVPDSPEKIQKKAAITLLLGAGATIEARLTALENAVKALSADTGP